MSKSKKTIDERVDDLKDPDHAGACADLNYMVFNYGKFHNNLVNQLIHIVFIPIIVFTYYVMACYIAEFDNTLNLPMFGDKIGFGAVPTFIVCVAYFFVDWKVALGVLAWWGPVMIIGNLTWANHREEEYFGMTQFWFMTAANLFSWIMQFIGHGVFE